MNYLVITDYAKKDINGKSTTVYKLLVLNERFEAINSGVCTEQQVVQAGNGAKALNFSIENGKILENNGKFDRLKDSNGVSPRIILAEMVSQGGKALGFVICDKNGKIVKVRREELMSLCKQSKEKGVAFIQNGIFRTTDGTDNIASYSGGEFIKFTVQPKKKLPEPKIAPHIEEARKAQAATPTQPVAPKAPAKTTKPVETAQAAKVEEKVKNSDRYSDAQKKELIAAKKSGVDPLIVSNPKLSPEQMRVIWTAKRNGMASEYFANPKFSVEQMEFFADHLVDKQTFNDCKGFINPKFSVGQLTELYLGVCDGVDISEYADAKLSEEDMYIKRETLSKSTYAKVLLENSPSGSKNRFLEKMMSRNKDE